MATAAVERNGTSETGKPAAEPVLMLCRAVDFITGQPTHTFLANPAAQDECFARAGRAVGQRPGHWDIQWQDDAVPSGWSSSGLSFTVANGRNHATVIATPVNPRKTCPHCETRQRYDRSVCDAAAKLKHAGLEYLATEMDWAQAMTQYSGYPSELIQFVESLARESDYDAVQVLVNRFYAQPEASFSDERV